MVMRPDTLTSFSFDSPDPARFQVEQQVLTQSIGGVDST